MQIAAACGVQFFGSHNAAFESFMVLCENHASRAAAQRIRRSMLQATAKPLHAIRNFDRTILSRDIATRAATARRRGRWHQVEQDMLPT
jgi:predicted metal-dependent hydrolase